VAGDPGEGRRGVTTLGLPFFAPVQATEDDSDDQHTPAWLLSLVFDLWPDGIDTDPAWSPKCHVAATLVYDGASAGADGLTQPWYGRVWCNPPYSDPAPWADRMAMHHLRTEAEGLFLVNVSTTTKWFARVRPDAGQAPGAARAVAFFRKRIAFIKGGVERRGNDREQMMLWWGSQKRLRRFREVFGKVAWIAT
jgi:hypothetical protein